VLTFTTAAYATFEPRQARFVKLTANGTNFVAVGDILIYIVKSIPSPKANGGRWGLTLNFPIVPVTAFLNPRKQKLITMASLVPDRFQANVDPPTTYAAMLDLKTKEITQQIITESGHDMFCPGTSYDETGRVIITGGDTPAAFSIYDPQAETFTNPKDKEGKAIKLKRPRGYQGQTFLPGGTTFMIGGEWSGGEDAKPRDGELFDPTNNTWKVLDNLKASLINMDPVTTCDAVKYPDKQCPVTEWQQHHAWLYAWKNNSIFHAGPSKKMHWFYTTPPKGSYVDVGTRKDDDDAVCGVTSMYDAEQGLILTAGGARNYHYWYDAKTKNPKDHRKEASKNAFQIQLGNDGKEVQVTKLPPMKYQRIFANAVILPTGETLVVGGQVQGEPFYDETWVPTPEIYSPSDNKWREVAPHSTPRGYHSWAMLMPDATVIVGGTGLDNPQTDHYDAQIYHPSYLYKANGVTPAERPEIQPIGNKEFKVGETIKITTTLEVDKEASLIRYGAATHALNNDMRRIKLKLKAEGSASDKKYSMTIPDNSGIALPGYWMLFVLRNGVPSHAETIRIRA
jgi:galactose oxidase